MTTRQMVTRRQFNKGTAATLLAAAAPMGCSGQDVNPGYEALATSTWRHSNGRIDGGAVLLKELVRYATLAANSHNTQPWRFRLGTNRIEVLPDFSRRCPAVDPDNHHLFATLGCATENLVLAAEANGLAANVSIVSSADAIRIELEPCPASKSPLFLAIPERQCTRALFDGKQVPSDQLAALESTAEGRGLAVRMLTRERDLESVLEYVVAGNQAVEVPEVRKQFSEYFDLGMGRPDLLVRFGYGPELPRSLRRPVEQVILQA